MMLAGVASLAVVAPAKAQDTTYSFNFPDQSLSTSLQEFALQTGMNLVYSPEIVANKRATALAGKWTPDQALRLLLRGTDIRFRVVRPNVISLTRLSVRERKNAEVLRERLSVVSQNLRAANAEAQRLKQDDGATGAVIGNVANAKTGALLAGARVRIQGTSLETVTNDRGQFYFPVVPSGQQTVVVEYLGEETQSISVSVARGQLRQADVLIGKSDDEIVVFGYRSSIQQALNKQKNADNNATIVSSDLLGGFPAETVSEALRRVPGVAFGRDNATGEGSRITVRGFSSEAINVQLNGLELQGTNFERTIDLSGFLADNISEIRIQKSLLPSLEASGSGGLVEIETKSGLDYGDFAVNLSLEGETGFDRAFGEEYQVGGTVAKKLTDNFGVAATVQFRKTDRTNYDVSVLSSTPQVLPAGFTSALLVPPPAQFPFDPEFESRLITGANYFQRDRDEENLLASVNLAWDIGSHTKLRLDLQRNQRDVLLENSRTAVSYRTTGVNMPIPELGGEVRRRTTLSGLAPVSALNVIDQRIRSSSISLRGNTILDRWTFDYKAGYSKAKAQSNNVNLTLIANTLSDLTGIIDPATAVVNPDDDVAMTPRIVDGGFVFASNGIPIPSLTPQGLAYITDPSQYNLTGASRTITDSPTEAYFLEGSAKYEFGGFLNYLKVGGKYDRSKRRSADDRFATATRGFLKPSVNYTRIFGRNTSADDIAPGLLDFPNLSDIGGNFTFAAIKPRSIDTIFDALSGLTADNPATAFNEERFRFTDASTLDPIADVGGLLPATTVEKRLAAFIEAKLVFGDFDAIGGVRFESVDRTGTVLSAPSVRLNLPGIQREPRATFVDAGLVQFVDVSGTTNTWTPSILVNYRPMDNLVARFGYFRSTVNPDFRLIRNSNTITIDLRPNFAAGRIREANPDLKPSTTDNFDFDVAYYFRDTPGLVRAGFFYKKISNNFTNVFFQNADNDTVRQRILDAFGQLAIDRPDLVDFAPGTAFTLNRPENGEGGKIYGFELELIRQLDFLPGFLKDFGVLGNLTYTKGDFPTLVTAFTDTRQVTQLSLDRPLADQAAWVYNASVNYAKGGFDGRLIYTRQSQTITSYTARDVNSILPAFSTLDLRLSYTFDKFGSNWTIFLEGDDLLRGSKEADIRSASGPTPGRADANFFFPNTYQFNGGRSVTMGVRARF